MPSLVIKNVPPVLHQRLKLEAEKHHRSMNGEAIAILEEKFGAATPAQIGPPVKTAIPLTEDFLKSAKSWGRP